MLSNPLVETIGTTFSVQTGQPRGKAFPFSIPNFPREWRSTATDWFGKMQRVNFGLTDQNGQPPEVDQNGPVTQNHNSPFYLTCLTCDRLLTSGVFGIMESTQPVSLGKRLD